MGESMSAAEFRAIKKKKRSKYKAVRTNGFASKAEAAYYEEILGPAEIGGEVTTERQPKFNIGCPASNYVADFKVTDRDTGAVWVVDVKGMETPKFKHDVKLWRLFGPHRLLIVKRKGKSWETTVVPKGTKLGRSE